MHLKKTDSGLGDATYPLPKDASPPGKWLSALAWVVAGSLVILAVMLGWQTLQGRPAFSALAALDDSSAQTSQAQKVNRGEVGQITLPTFEARDETNLPPGIDRHPDLHTIIPERPNEAIRQYTVQQGDSVFEIAARFGLKPESVLWANYDQLNDNPDLLSLGMSLNIPPVNGVLHIWREGDTIEGVAAQYQTTAEQILSWPGNQLDLVELKIDPGSLLIVPDGKREYRQWIIPTIPRGRAGVSQALYGAGACEGSYDGAYGSGAFIWPAGNHILSGNDYWDGHLAIDIAAGEGAPIYAADSGVVVFAGWATGGYGNMVMIDHGNGYQTLYAHLSSVKVGCGQSVSQGAIIGFGGTTGNSTGPHLHFEVRYQGGFVNPWYVLPAP